MSDGCEHLHRRKTNLTPWNLNTLNLWMSRSNQVMMSKWIFCSMDFSDEAFFIPMHRNCRNACWKGWDWSRARAAISRCICWRGGWRCRESTRPTSAFPVPRPNTSHKHPTCCSWCCPSRRSGTKHAFASVLVWKMCMISNKRKSKMSTVMQSDTKMI